MTSRHNDLTSRHNSLKSSFKTLMSTCQMLSICQMMSACQIIYGLVISLCGLVRKCCCSSKEHVFEINFLTNELRQVNIKIWQVKIIIYLTRRHKDLHSRHNNLTSNGSNIPPLYSVLNMHFVRQIPPSSYQTLIIICR